MAKEDTPRKSFGGALVTVLVVTAAYALVFKAFGISTLSWTATLVPLYVALGVLALSALSLGALVLVAAAHERRQQKAEDERRERLREALRKIGESQPRAVPRPLRKIGESQPRAVPRPRPNDPHLS